MIMSSASAGSSMPYSVCSEAECEVRWWMDMYRACLEIRLGREGMWFPSVVTVAIPVLAYEGQSIATS